MSEQEWHIEYGPNPFAVGHSEFMWRLRDERGWFELWTKKTDAWDKARPGARRVCRDGKRENGSTKRPASAECGSDACYTAPLHGEHSPLHQR
jgi:hypothetical protein